MTRITIPLSDKAAEVLKTLRTASKRSAGQEAAFHLEPVLLAKAKAKKKPRR